MTVPVGIDRQSQASPPAEVAQPCVPETYSSASAPSLTPQRPGWSLQEVLLLGQGVVLTLVISYTFGHGRIFWEDEMLGWMMLRDPSWRHMLQAWKLGADGGGFAFYLTGRAWFSLFGPSEVSFRMYSGVCFAAAFGVVWLTVRRFYRLGIVTFALYNTFFFSPPIVLHMAEGRFYGLLVLGTALAAWLATLPPRVTRISPGRLCGLAFLIHALLTTSHLLGIVYSVSLVIATALIDRSRGHMRPQLYLAAAASWLLLLPERTAILASAAVGKPFFWTTQPTVRRFLGAYSAFSAEIAGVLLVLAVTAGLTLWFDRRTKPTHLPMAPQERGPVYVLTLTLLLIPLAFFVEGFVGPALFISRYLLPIIIAQTMLTAEAATLIAESHSFSALRDRAARSTLAKSLAIGGFAVALLLWVFLHLKPLAIGQENYTDALSAMLPKGIPVLCEDAWSFTELIGRQHASGVRYTYLLDWPQSLSPSAPRLEVTQYHLMQNWRKAGYFSGSIVDRDEFLRQHRQFLVLHTIAPAAPDVPPEIGNPLVERFQHDPAYTVQRFASLDRTSFSESAWRVCRGPCL